jgi:hypothetical protein
MSNPKSKRWPELGIITKNEVKDKAGNVIKDSSGNPLTRLDFKLNEDITVLYKGEPVSLNKYRTGVMVSPVEEVEGLYKNGVIGDDKIEERRETAKNAHKWLRYKVQLPPPRVEKE